MSDLTATEASKLVKKINDSADRIEQTVAETRRMCLEFRDRHGWKAMGYKSLDACCKEVFTFGKGHFYRLASAGETEQKVSRARDSSALSTRVIERLSKVDPDQVKKVVNLAEREAEQDNDENPVITERHVARAIKQVKAEQPEQAEPEPDEPDPICDERGEPVPECMVDVFADQDSWKQGRKLLTDAKRLFQGLAETESGRQSDIHAALNSVKTALAELNSRMPHAFCDACRGEGCDICDDMGWFTKPGWKAARG